MKKHVAAILSGLLGAGIGCGLIYKKEHGKLKKALELDRKNDAIIRLFGKWNCLKQEGKSVADYLLENEYKHIAIYGMHHMGKCLLNELQGSEICVDYAIDKRPENAEELIKVYLPDEDLPVVDAVIVTAFFYFDEIEDHLNNQLDCPIISIEDILYEME